MIPGFAGHLVPEDLLESRLHEGRLHDARELQAAIASWRRSGQALGPASALRAMVDVGAVPLLRALGFTPSAATSGPRDSCLSVCRAGSTPVLVVVTAWGATLASVWRAAVVEATSRHIEWCLLFNGTHLRLLRASRLFSRRHAEIDLDAAADDPRAAATLALLCSHAAFANQPSGRSGLEALLADGDQHAARVCRSLRGGVLEASTHVLHALASTDRSHRVDDVFEQSLTIVYRLLFLFFAEARGLVPLWHPVYRESYSAQALRDAALRPQTPGLWDGLRAIARLAHAGCRAGSLNVTAFNGRLFAPARTPLAERRNLDDGHARRAILAVSTRPARDREGREPISYRDLGVEQLGAVYETLLDYTPRIERAARGRPLRVSLEAGSGIRKATGTFYTPEPLVAYLLRDTLGPLVRGASPEQILALKVLDPSMGSGAFLVGACRYLAEAYEHALIEHGRCHAADIGPADRSAMRRTVAERCLFGVDINPTAVQLARLSLWLTTLAADRPLTFLDHHLRIGDSLAGTWVARLREPPVRRGTTSDLPLFPEMPMSHALRQALPVRFSLAQDPNDTAGQVRAKERAMAALDAPDSALSTWRRVADTWCAAWFASPPVPPGTFRALADAILTGCSSLPGATVAELSRRSTEAAQARRLFHWELEFPEAFFDRDGTRLPHAGFDAIVGNPPWDMVRADTGADRARARADATALVRFSRDSGVYDTRSDGHVNRYQLFVERAVALTRPGGRLGLVLPSGILSDSGSAALRRLILSRCDVERLVGFDNRTGTFPIHRSVRFVLLSATAGTATREIACRFGETDVTALDRAVDAADASDPHWFATRVTTGLLARISGDDLSIPDVRSPIDVAIVDRAAALFPPLSSPGGWHARFSRELNASDDRSAFRTDGVGLPVLEGKSIQPFRTDTGHTRFHIPPADADRLLGPRYRRTRLAYRDVASATNRVTLIAALLPPHSVSVHTLFCLRTTLPPRSQRLLCALFNSLVVNFLVRLRVTTHVTTAIVERLPVPPEDRCGPDAAVLTACAEVLASGHEVDRWVQLNAVVARLYRLTEQEFAHVLSTFPLIDRGERDAMLRAFRIGT